MTSKHPTQKNRRKPFLTDNVELGRKFRERFVDGLERLITQHKLRLQDEFAGLLQERQRKAWLKKLEDTDWNVFIEGPPGGQSKPEHVLKYLARYMSGGPIGDGRLISSDGNWVTFWARTKDKSKGNPSQPFRLRCTEFVRRWCLHILPKGYTRSRSYGGFHGTKRHRYLAHCRQLLQIISSEGDEANRIDVEDVDQGRLPKCPHCRVETRCIESFPRPSWRTIFATAIYIEPVYCPLLQTSFGLLRPYSIGGYG